MVTYHGFPTYPIHGCPLLEAHVQLTKAHEGGTLGRVVRLVASWASHDQ